MSGRGMKAKLSVLVVVALVVVVLMSAVSCRGFNVSKPKIGVIPEGWELVEEYGYGAYNLNGVKLGGMLYEDDGGSFVLVMYGDIPGWILEGSGEENDPLTKVIKTTSVFDSVQTGSMKIGEYSASYYESCGGAWCEMGISFIEGYPWVRGSTWIGIYTYFTSTEEDKAMSLIESIYF